jgi:hypothetical protein
MPVVAAGGEKVWVGRHGRRPETPGSQVGRMSRRDEVEGETTAGTRSFHRAILGRSKRRWLSTIRDAPRHRGPTGIQR